MYFILNRKKETYIKRATDNGHPANPRPARIYKMLFVWKTREEFKRHVKLCQGDEPREYIILDEAEITEHNREEITEYRKEYEQATNTHIKEWHNITQDRDTEPTQHATTQYFNIQDPTTPEEAQPPTPTKEERKYIINKYLETAELIPDAEYKQLKEELKPPEDTTPILDEEEDQQEPDNIFYKYTNARGEEGTISEYLRTTNGQILTTINYKQAENGRKRKKNN